MENVQTAYRDTVHHFNAFSRCSGHVQWAFGFLWICCCTVQLHVVQQMRNKSNSVMEFRLKRIHRRAASVGKYLTDTAGFPLIRSVRRAVERSHDLQTINKQLLYKEVWNCGYFRNPRTLQRSTLPLQHLLVVSKQVNIPVRLRD